MILLLPTSSHRTRGEARVGKINGVAVRPGPTPGTSPSVAARSQVHSQPGCLSKMRMATSRPLAPHGRGRTNQCRIKGPASGRNRESGRERTAILWQPRPADGVLAQGPRLPATAWEFGVRAPPPPPPPPPHLRGARCSSGG